MAYSDKQKENILTKVCERICSGEALRNILLDKGMPSYSTFYIWIEEDEVKSKQYACACEERQDFMFEQMLDIADATANDIIMKDGHEIVNNNVINRDKLRIDTRKWALSKLNPKKYGDKIQTDITTKGESIIPQSPEEREKEIEELIEKAKKK